jgi:hypothetical protein
VGGGRGISLPVEFFLIHTGNKSIDPFLGVCVCRRAWGVVYWPFKEVEGLLIAMN